VSDKQPGRPDGETEMTTLPTPYAPSYTTYRADDDTVRMPLPTATPTHRNPEPIADHTLGYADHGYTDQAVAEHRPTAPAFEATKLWTGGLATAAVAALVGLVGTLVIRVLFEYAPVGTAAVHAFTTADAGLLCLFAALAALAATGIAHLLMVSTPDPLSYLGWIIGLSTAAAVVVPLLGTTALAAAIATAVVHLVIGLAIGSLVIGTAMSARRPAAR
jgi:hypothetical protein